MQPYEFLTKDQVEQVHDASMQILQKVGIDFRYPPALEILKKGGAKVDGERVFFPAQLVEAQIKKAPAEFRLRCGHRGQPHGIYSGLRCAFCYRSG